MILDYVIIHCKKCNSENKVPTNKQIKYIKCGNCQNILCDVAGNIYYTNEDNKPTIVICPHCYLINSIPPSVSHLIVKCGNCKTLLLDNSTN